MLRNAYFLVNTPLFYRTLALCTAGILLLDIWSWIWPGVLGGSEMVRTTM
jgi:hypothetical protein